MAGLLNRRARRLAAEVRRPTGGSRPDGWRAGPGSAKRPERTHLGAWPRAWPSRAPGGVACCPARAWERPGTARACVSAAPGFAGAARRLGRREEAGATVSERWALGRARGWAAARRPGRSARRGCGRREARTAGTKGRGATAFGTSDPGAGVGLRAPPPRSPGSPEDGGKTLGAAGGVCGSLRPAAATGAHRLWAGCPGSRLGPRGAGEKMGLLTVPRRRSGALDFLFQNGVIPHAEPVV